MRRLILFAKRPRAGHVKTRLARQLGSEGAADLYRAFLRDEWDRLSRFSGRAAVEWCTDGPTSDPLPAEIRRTAQGGGDLGRRLLRAFRRSHRTGTRATVVIGADSPTLPDERIDEAFRGLESGAELVLLPSDDGGYALIGLRRPWPELFRDIPWSEPTVLARTLDRARSLELDVACLAPWYDVDDGRGYRRLCRELRASPAAAPHTARWLASGKRRATATRTR